MLRNNQPESLSEILYQFGRYCRNHERTGLGNEGITQPEAEAAILALIESERPETLVGG